MDRRSFRHMAAAYYVCHTGHDEVRWHRFGGHSCWYCGATGIPARGLTITSALLAIDDEEAAA